MYVTLAWLTCRRLYDGGFGGFPKQTQGNNQDYSISLGRLCCAATAGIKTIDTGAKLWRQ